MIFVVAQAVRRLNLGRTDGSYWESLRRMGAEEFNGCDDLGGGFAFEGCVEDLGGWVIVRSTMGIGYCIGYNTQLRLT
jgi:hypothetical protein